MKLFYIKLKNLIKKFVKTLFYLNPYLYYFNFKNLLLPTRIRKVVYRLFPIIDQFIVFRKPKYLVQFLSNLKNITNKYIVMTWSNSYPHFYAPRNMSLL